jgi:chromosome segregation protein
MMQPTETESADIRRALDRLQSTFEALGERYREMRRERKQLRAQIEELQQEREGAELSIQSKLETAVVDRRRTIELEERVVQAEKRTADLHDRMRELEDTLARRESAILEQEELISSLRARIDSDRQREELGWAQEEKLREEVVAAREQIARASVEAEMYQARIVKLEQEGRQQEALQAEAEELRRRIVGLQTERSRLEEQQLQFAAKLDAATRDTSLARIRVAELERQLAASTDDERLAGQQAELERLRRELSDAVDLGARKELETIEKGREIESLRRSLDEVNRQAEILRTRCKQLTTEVERRAGELTIFNGSAAHDEDRREMVEQIQQAIQLIDKHLEGT